MQLPQLLVWCPKEVVAALLHAWADCCLASRGIAVCLDIAIKAGSHKKWLASSTSGRQIHIACIAQHYTDRLTLLKKRAAVGAVAAGQ